MMLVREKLMATNHRLEQLMLQLDRVEAADDQTDE
jgi:hypothetical protein